MPAPSPQRIRDLFDAALALPDSGRADFLASQCGDDAALHAAVSRLLRADKASAGFLNSATLSQHGDPLTDASGISAGERIGPYVITGELGRGGGGVVYLARQRSPVDREVALKMLSSSTKSHQTAERFRSEQRTLARMEHEHIARLYDAGVDPRGRLWFAMELVRGEPVNVFCDWHKLTLAARLRLFAEICRAVHHAHLRGVIHRDLKPSNLLVGGDAAHPVPKVIDFGIARALENSEDPALTMAGGIIGTPAWMSPEQFGDGTGEVDARTDIYSLGLVLFEISTGLQAREIPSSGSAALHAARSILTEDPPAPAARFSQQSHTRQEELAAARLTDPRTLRQFLSGDAGRIITKCLSRAPADRFPSAESLAADIENLLAHRPLSFRRPGWWYPAGKFLRRHRTAAITSAMAFLIAAGGLVSGIESRLARLKAEARAGAEAGRAAQESARAVREGRKGFLITQAMTGLFRSATPEYGLPTDRTVRSVVESWTARLPDSVMEDPEVEALARLSLGNAWNGFGDPAQSRFQYEKAAALLHDPSPAFTPARALAELNLASLDFREHRYQSAGTRLQLARRYYSAATGDYTAELLRAELLLAGQRAGEGHIQEAAATAKRVLDEALTSLPDAYELQARAHWHLARIARAAGDLPVWEQHLRERLTLLHRLEKTRSNPDSGGAIRSASSRLSRQPRPPRHPVRDGSNHHGLHRPEQSRLSFRAGLPFGHRRPPWPNRRPRRRENPLSDSAPGRPGLTLPGRMGSGAERN